MRSRISSELSKLLLKLVADPLEVGKRNLPPVGFISNDQIG